MKNGNEPLENISIDHKVIGFCLDYEFFHKVKNILDSNVEKREPDLKNYSNTNLRAILLSYRAPKHINKPMRR